MSVAIAPETALRRAALIITHPSGNRSRVSVEPLPFLIGRHADNHLILKDNRASRSHSRIVLEGGSYIVEDMNSRHGTWVNGTRVGRHVLRNADRIDFGVRDSYTLTFTYETDEIHRLLDQISSTSRSGGMGSGNLVKLRALVEVARALQNSLSTEEVLTTVVDAALAVTGCERGFLLLRQGEDLQVAVARDREGRVIHSDDLHVPVHVIQRALKQRRDLLCMSLDQPGAGGTFEDTLIRDVDPRSVVCVPLIHIKGGVEETRVSSTIEDTVGLLYMHSREGSADLSAGNRELLETLALEASTILENARLLDEERAKQRIEDELKIARSIQEGLLPGELPATGWFRAAGASIPSTQVGGDYFDVRQVSPDAWAAVVADVSGKGVSSALLASFLQGAFLMAAPSPAAIERMFERLNIFLLERTRGEKYATIFYCMLDERGVLSWANAGHCAPYLLHYNGRLQKLHTTGMPVGMVEGATVQMMQTQLAPRDKVVIYSDGLTEAENAEGQFFDNDRLRRLLTVHGPLSAAEIHAKLLQAVDQFTEGGVVRDDITAVVLEYAP